MEPQIHPDFTCLFRFEAMKNVFFQMVRIFGVMILAVKVDARLSNWLVIPALHDPVMIRAIGLVK